MALTLSACAGMERVSYTPVASAAARVLPGEGEAAPIRFKASGDREQYDAWIKAVNADRRASGLAKPRELLVISGGSDKGAYTAGLLNQWSKAGTRPEFDLVTGVSTGALIAPFAFLGADEDATLTEIYTGVSPADIYRSRPLGVLFGKSAVARTEPLQELIARYTTREFLDRIAAEHRKGRRLLVMTTQLDSARGVIWDMGAIASSSAPNAAELFRQVLLASASIPGVFPPVFVEANDGNLSFAEMHVDGGVVSSFFVLPLELLERRMQTTQAERDPRRIWILYNGKIQPKFEVTKADVFSIMQRALTVTLAASDQSYLAGLEVFGRENDVSIALCSLEKDIASQEAEIFDTQRMNEFYQVGIQAVEEESGCLERPMSDFKNR